MFEESVAAVGPELAGRLAALRLDDVDDDGLIDGIAAAERLARWAAAAQLALISEVARRTSDSEFVVDQVATELRLSRVAAGTRLGLAFDAERLPAVAAGLAGGQLDVPKAQAIADGVRVLDEPARHQVAVAATEHASQHTVGEVKAWLRRTVLSADPSAAERRHAQAVADRRVTVRAVDDGMAELWALLPADAAERVYKAVDAAARVAASPTDSRTSNQRRADTLVDLVTGRRVPPPASVHVTVPLATLVHAAEHPGELADLGPIPAGMARQLAADGTWRWLATSDLGTIVDAGRRRYRPSAALAALIRGRDLTCRFPGCRQPAARCDLDHTVPYPAGATSPENLASLCRHHHRLKQSAGWAVRQGREGELIWRSPTGRIYVTTPPGCSALWSPAPTSRPRNSPPPRSPAGTGPESPERPGRWPPRPRR